MSELLAKIKRKAAVLDHRSRQAVDLDKIMIEAGALKEIAPYLEEKALRTIAIAVDALTYEAAGHALETLLSRVGIRPNVTIIKPSSAGDVVADEASIVQLLLDIQRVKAEAVVAVGGGTIHDIARYCAFTSRIPFVSVPTAPSVDGFNSKGAPILVRGEKLTIPAIGPSAIFADMDILSGSPPALIVAGFGDMLGKFTSLFDWKFGAIVADEPYLQTAADITREALMSCVNEADSIALGREEGIHTLITALIESGLAMLLFGQSHPASGAEHHLSHYIEMEFLRLGRRQLLHGAKVGVASAHISKLYHRIISEGPERWNTDDKNSKDARMASNWVEIARHSQQIPDELTLRDLLRQVGGPATIEQLSVEQELIERSLKEAHHVRPDRYTLLRAFNEREIAP
ncbi:sn-glycerol-1-phosphate dehydrogenase [Cohnella lupini]|uniref:Glycerol-1-phosphate dehydrogenase [NAD(P)+] n=1 Tax=Cohnella lupini TaxID=1294267 RepID=A0A3D9IX07_9BACL|nr:sn-glycerol-1-phosphate dehydrogenase [Cohnella lupini]RED66373.1 glycerol-1-phosphate dehydrogenase [NAD(P)+] [Cohnella lupini]